MRKTQKVMASVIANAEKELKKLERSIEKDNNNKKDE